MPIFTLGCRDLNARLSSLSLHSLRTRLFSGRGAGGEVNPLVKTQLYLWGYAPSFLYRIVIHIVGFPSVQRRFPYSLIPYRRSRARVKTSKLLPGKGKCVLCGDLLARLA